MSFSSSGRSLSLSSRLFLSFVFLHLFDYQSPLLIQTFFIRTVQMLMLFPQVFVIRSYVVFFTFVTIFSFFLTSVKGFLRSDPVLLFIPVSSLVRILKLAAFVAFSYFFLFIHYSRFSVIIFPFFFSTSSKISFCPQSLPVVITYSISLSLQFFVRPCMCDFQYHDNVQTYSQGVLWKFFKHHHKVQLPLLDHFYHQNY